MSLALHLSSRGLLACAALLIAGCGQKGSLTLPAAPAAAASASTPTPQAPR